MDGLGPKKKRNWQKFLNSMGVFVNFLFLRQEIREPPPHTGVQRR
jgi:hypothetical protein